ncbi:MAG: LLM class flavin-dependent oxidoreductase [Armatimonadota bacterium]|nr:LLM class flavin-dependent oxidoreductase [Armatimonadota bacterium]MDR7444513.1 LLM class flavin-dependent oxidoreductase [Armatimonadota bacterium]MDR7570691.1 LLM class flavin-dependent oxidoreductase [Armatimonadota bacterium]MDR7615304.1 LLM class flavin-dependent oxidoreductase [Armatimonadota bacterium]
MKYDIELNSAAHYPADQVVGLAVLAEEAGFGALWKGESNSTDPLVLLSAVASRTQRLLLGTAIYHIHGRSPVTLGIQAATLQDLSGGRFLLGLGVGNENIAGWHGSTLTKPLERIREYIEIVRRVARGERVEHQGHFYSTGQRFRLAWRPRYGPPPVYVAALGPRMAHLAGAVGDGVLINMALPQKIREIAANVRRGAEDAGKDPNSVEIIAKVRVSVHPDERKARSRLRQVLTFYNLAEYYRDMLREMGFRAEVDRVHEAFREGGFKAAQEAITDEYMDRLPVIPAASVEEVRARLEPFAEAGVTRLIIPYVPAEDPPAEDAARFLRAWSAVRV